MRLPSSCFGKSHLLLSSVYLSKWTLESLWNFHEIPLGLGKSINSVWKNGIRQCRFLSPLRCCFVWSGSEEVRWKSWPLPHVFPAFVCKSFCRALLIIAAASFCIHLKYSFMIFNCFLRLIFIYVFVFLCKRMPYMFRCLWKSEESILCSGTRLIEGSELPDMGAGSRTHVLCRNCMHSQSLSHLSRPRIVFLKFKNDVNIIILLK